MASPSVSSIDLGDKMHSICVIDATGETIAANLLSGDLKYSCRAIQSAFNLRLEPPQNVGSSASDCAQAMAIEVL